MANKPSPWLSTAAACQRLDVSRWVLATARDSRQLRKGYHWKVKNPHAARLTYLWHVDRLEKWQSQVKTQPGA
ncbi:hypothetical protein IQ265_00705 [Nodosilinea sp. LEGE 06152]|uniref:hypothetical protein n=1 Tax=Nodosilinea sp. LEGE 06152 TaxID=2777966 RepID=UPI0018824A8D|nr:hypothetical protein [Nodosilinea sp. LEGE 06152]MBE9155367.1 hypothetical protein [Nodosilinea sp. LEGE 06152]